MVIINNNKKYNLCGLEVELVFENSAVHVHINVLYLRRCALSCKAFINFFSSPKLRLKA